jgi:hypothetical protein
MSISSATDRVVASSRRVQPGHMVGVLLLAIGLIAIVVAIAISSTTSGTGRVSAGPATINAPQSHPAAQPTSATVPNVPRGTFRDPVTHALLAVGAPAAPQAEPGLGHR